MSFWTFYSTTFKAEHTHWANIFLHVCGTLLSLAFPIWAVLSGRWLWLPLYPVVHAAPGLLGHRLFEQNKQVGNLRVFRTDYPGYWFLFGNHVMTFELLTFRFRRFKE